MVAGRLLQAGYVVLTPIGDNQRYDLVIDVSGKFWRIQCKKGRLNRLKSAVQFDVCSVYSHKPGEQVTRTYRGTADFFGVFCDELDKVFIVPVAKCGIKECHLRLSQKHKVPSSRFAADYEIGRLAEWLKAPHR